MTEATPKQAAVLAFVGTYTASKGYPPSLREIADEFGLGSASAAKIHVVALKKKGLLTWQEGKARTLRVVG